MPELSLNTLSWINGVLLLLYLPLGFMFWVFAAAGYANRPQDTTRQQRWVLALACLPLLLLIVVLVLPHWLAEPWATRLAWGPLGVVALILALTFVSAAVTGFLQGTREANLDQEPAPSDPAPSDPAPSDPAPSDPAPSDET